MRAKTFLNKVFQGFRLIFVTKFAKFRKKILVEGLNHDIKLKQEI